MKEIRALNIKAFLEEPKIENQARLLVPLTPEKLDNAVFFFALILVILSETLSYNTLGIAFSFFQAFLVVFQILRRKIVLAVSMHTLFVLTALEWPADLTSRPAIYTYRTVDFFGVSISTIVLAIFFTISLLHFRKHVTFNRNTTLMLLMFLIASLTGTFGVIFSDYNIGFFISDIQYWFVLLMSTSLAVTIFTRYPAFRKLFEKILIWVLASRAIVVFFGSILGFNKGSYGGLSIFSYDAIDFLIPLIILALKEQQSAFMKILITGSWILGTFSTVVLQSSGKGILLTGFVFLILIIKLLVSKGHFFRTILGIVLVFAILFMSLHVIPSLLEKNLLFSIKYNQVISLISLKWLTNPYILPNSPRDRVLELYNIVAYYIEYPLFFLTGRGFGGYFEDKAFYNYTASNQGGYSTQEVKTRKFVNPHQSFSVVLLKFGLAGLVLWISILLKFLKPSRKLYMSLFLKVVSFVLLLLALGFSLKLAFIIGFCLDIMIKGRSKYAESPVH